MNDVEDWQTSCGGMSGHEARGSDIMDVLSHQLHMARYAFHKVKVKQYHDQHMLGMMSIEQAKSMYNAAMINYDELIKHSADGSVTEADQLDMEAGFPL